jgi:hypothetical protein
MIEIFQYKKDKWVFLTYGCQYCTRTFKTDRYCVKHEEECERINTIKKYKEELDMPVQRITKGGETYFRKGNEGRMYKTLEEAESSPKSMKKKGADGKACWEGYRFAGTKNGKDNCVKIKGR